MTNFEPAAEGFPEQRQVSRDEFDMGRARLSMMRRITLLDKYVGNEFAAFQFFRRIGQAAVAHGCEIEEEYDTTLPPGEGSLIFRYPDIGHDPEPGNDERRRVIRMQEVHVLEGDEVVSVTPWLQVYETDDDGETATCPEFEYVRDDLAVFCGWGDYTDMDAGIGQAFFEDYSDDGQLLRIRLQQQAEYVDWLERAAEALGMPRQFGYDAGLREYDTTDS